MDVVNFLLLYLCTCRFQVREKLSGVESWLVYLIDLDGDVAVAKLANRYGWAVHKAWADAGVAPQLHLEHCR